MNLGLSETQQMLKQSAREFLDKNCSPAYIREMERSERGFTDEVWGEIADLGWLGLPFPEEYGGSGLSFLDLCVVLEEMGRSLFRDPFFSTVVECGLTVLEAGTEKQKRQLLTGIARGDLLMSMALTEAGARWDAGGISDTRATGDKGGFVINGTKLFVPNASVADHLIVAARTKKAQDPRDGVTLFLVPKDHPGVAVTPMRLLSSETQSEVAFTNVKVSSDSVLGAVDGGWPVIRKAHQRAIAGLGCWMLGGTREVLNLTVEYTKARIQFGRPIGSFQAIQHHCADMALDMLVGQNLAYRAAWKVSSGQEPQSEASMAKAWISDAYNRMCALAHQCHGAAGLTEEYRLQMYSRRAKVAEVMFGDADFHREHVAAAMTRAV